MFHCFSALILACDRVSSCHSFQPVYTSSHTMFSLYNSNVLCIQFFVNTDNLRQYALNIYSVCLLTCFIICAIWLNAKHSALNTEY